MSTWPLTPTPGEQERCSRERTVSLGVRTGPCRQTDRRWRPWDPLTPAFTSRVVQQLSHLLGALFAHLGAGVVLVSPALWYHPFPPSLEAAVPLPSGGWTWEWHCTPMPAARLQSSPRAQVTGMRDTIQVGLVGQDPGLERWERGSAESTSPELGVDVALQEGTGSLGEDSPRRQRECLMQRDQ